MRLRGELTQFEYIVGFVSILMGLAVAELLAGLSLIVRERSTTKIYWVHVTWMILLIGVCTQSWWIIWYVRGHEIGTITHFVLLVLPRFLYVVLAFLLSPPIVHNQRFDLREYYFHQFRWVAILTAAALAGTIAYRSVLGIETLTHPLNAVRAASGGLLVALSFSKSPRIHEATTVALCILLALAFALA